MRLTEVRDPKRLEQWVTRAHILVKVIHQSDARDPLPSEFVVWAQNANLTVNMEEDLATGGDDDLPSEDPPIVDPPTKSQTGTKVKTRVDFQPSNDLHSTLRDELNQTLSQAQANSLERERQLNERLEFMAEQNGRMINDLMNQTNRQKSEFQRSVIDALRAVQPQTQHTNNPPHTHPSDQSRTQRSDSSNPTDLNFPLPHRVLFLNPQRHVCHTECPITQMKLHGGLL